MSGQYRKHGLDFLYPENWKLVDDPDWGLPFQISIESEAGAMISITFLELETQVEAILKDAIDGFVEQYEDLELIPPKSLEGEFPGQGVDAMFFCLDFLVFATIRVYSTSKFQVLVVSQAENRTFEQNQMVFQAIATGLLRNV